MSLNPVKKILERQDGTRMSQYLASLSACIVLFVAGIHLGWPSPSLKIILSADYPFQIDEEEASYIVIISCLGHVIGGMTASALADIIGRKWTVLSIAIPQLISLIMIQFSWYSKSLLYLARIFGGIGEGAALACVPTYIAEIAEPAVRGLLGTCMPLFFVFGMLFVNIIGSYLDIYKTALVSMIFPILQWLLFVNFPETPYYYLMKKNKEQATQSLAILRRRNSVWKEMEQLSADVARQMSDRGGYKDLFIVPANRKAFFIMSAARFFQQFTGCSAFGLYYQKLVSETTNLSPVLGSSMLLVTQIVVTSFSSFFVDKLGRKPLFTISAILSCIMLFIQAIFITLRTYSDLDLSNLQWLPLFIMLSFTICFTFGLGIMNILFSEMFSSSIKAKAYSLLSIVFALSIMGSTKYYQYTADNFGQHVPFYSFGVSTLVATFFFYFVVPETKGKSLEEIQQDLRGTKRVETKNDVDSKS